jgi:hypothetical protein
MLLYILLLLIGSGLIVLCAHVTAATLDSRQTRGGVRTVIALVVLFTLSAGISMAMVALISQIIEELA